MFSAKFYGRDVVYHPMYPDWVWGLVRHFAADGNYGIWVLQFKLSENPFWPRLDDRPKIGHTRVLGYSALDPSTEMELLALVSQ